MHRLIVRVKFWIASPVSSLRIYGLCFFICCLLFSVPLICPYIHYITLILWVMDRGKGAQIDLCDRETFFANEVFVQTSAAYSSHNTFPTR